MTLDELLDDDSPATAAGPDPASEADRRRRPKLHPRLILATNLLRSALTRRQSRSLRATDSIIVVLVVPEAAWKAPLADAARRMGRWDSVFKPSSKRRGAAPDIDASDLAEAVASGHRVLVVTDDPAATLPRFLLTTADLTITVPRPGDEVIRRTIAAVTRRRVKSVPAGIAKGLGYEELLGAVRASTDPGDCVERLLAAADRKAARDPVLEKAPDLHALAGYGEAMTWCRKLVRDIEDWRAGKGPFPTGARVVFAGPPGTGKTTLVRAVSKAARLPLVATSTGAWFAGSEGHLGDVVKAIQGVWDAARLAAPCVLFLDELDSIPDRSRLSDRAREWWTPVVTHLLTLLDGANATSSDLVILGATNFPAALDPALVRPGRMERVIHIDLPQTEGESEGILRHLLGSDLVGDDLSAVTPMVVGMSGAELMALVRDARGKARFEGRALEVRDLVEPLSPPDVRPPAAIRRCAIHEAGHAVGARSFGHVLHSVSIIERAGSAGRVSGSLDLQDMPTKAVLEEAVVAMLCGMAAEEQLLGTRSTGAGGDPGSDLDKATKLVASLRASYGLAGPLAFRASASEATVLLREDPEFRTRVEEDLMRLYGRAGELALANADAIRRLSERLVTARFLTGAQVEGLLAGHVPVAAPKPEASLRPEKSRRDVAGRKRNPG